MGLCGLVGLWAVGCTQQQHLQLGPVSSASSSTGRRCTLAALGTSGTLGDGKGGTGHLWAPWTWQARKGRVRSGPWALSGTSQGGK